MSEHKQNKIHLISVGTELLTADRLDTNAHEIQGLLLKAGFRVTRSVIVGDDHDAVSTEVRRAAGEADTVITTGGLGPTADDVTRSAVAAAAGVELVEDPQARENLESFFRRIGREMTPSNLCQAQVPRGARVIPNPVGTAPAFCAEVGDASVYCLPGVPAEMRTLMRESVLPLLKEQLGDEGPPPVRAKVYLVGVAESSANDQIRDLLARSDLRVGITVHHAVITITLTADGPSAGTVVEEARRQVVRTFGPKVFGEGEGTRLEQVVGDLLIGRRITFALAESCTGGLIGHRFTEVPGISSVFLEGVVSYSGDAKERSLGIPGALMEKHGQVSEEVAKAMALGAAARAGARAGLSVTGIAGPGGGTAEKPVGLVHMAACLDGRVRHKKVVFTGDRSQVKLRTANFAMDLLRRAVLEWDSAKDS